MSGIWKIREWDLDDDRVGFGRLGSGIWEIME